MRHDEFNDLKITNDRETFKGEFTRAQNVEYSTIANETITHDSELNEKEIVNETFKDKEEKKERKDSKVDEKTLKKAAEAGAKATSTAGAISGTAATGIVASAIVGLSVVGTGIGFNLFGPTEATTDPYEIVSMEVAATSIDYFIKMPLSYFDKDSQTGEPIYIESDMQRFQANIMPKGGEEEDLVSINFESHEFDIENNVGYLMGYWEYLTPNTDYEFYVTRLEGEIGLSDTYSLFGSKHSFKTPALSYTYSFESFTVTGKNVEALLKMPLTNFEIDPNTGGYITTYGNYPIYRGLLTKVNDSSYQEVIDLQFRFSDTEATSSITITDTEFSTSYVLAIQRIDTATYEYIQIGNTKSFTTGERIYTYTYEKYNLTSSKATYTISMPLDNFDFDDNGRPITSIDNQSVFRMKFANDYGYESDNADMTFIQDGDNMVTEGEIDVSSYQGQTMKLMIQHLEMKSAGYGYTDIDDGMTIEIPIARMDYYGLGFGKVSIENKTLEFGVQYYDRTGGDLVGFKLDIVCETDDSITDSFDLSKDDFPSGTRGTITFSKYDMDIYVKNTFTYTLTAVFSDQYTEVLQTTEGLKFEVSEQYYFFGYDIQALYYSTGNLEISINTYFATTPTRIELHISQTGSTSSAVFYLTYDDDVQYAQDTTFAFSGESGYTLQFVAYYPSGGSDIIYTVQDISIPNAD